LEVHIHHTLEIGIGLHSGSVIVGNIIINKTNHLIEMDYPANIASRIQSATLDLNKNFLISEKVAELIFGCSSQESQK